MPADNTEGWNPASGSASAQLQGSAAILGKRAKTAQRLVMLESKRVGSAPICVPCAAYAGI